MNKNILIYLYHLYKMLSKNSKISNMTLDTIKAEVLNRVLPKKQKINFKRCTPQLFIMEIKIKNQIFN